MNLWVWASFNVVSVAILVRLVYTKVYLEEKEQVQIKDSKMAAPAETSSDKPRALQYQVVLFYFLIKKFENCSN